MDKLSSFYNEIYPKELKNDIEKMPLSFQINLLNQCYQKCIGCRKYHWKPEELPIKMIKRILDNASNSTVVYSGGEPLLYEYINELLEYTIKSNVQYGILTSALFPKSLNIQYLIETASYISVSVDGATSEVFEKTRGIDCLPKVIENIKAFLKIKKELNSNCRIRINSTISNLNIHEMVKIFKLAESLEIDCNFFPIHTWDNLKTLDSSEVFIKSIMETFECSLKSSINTNIKDFKEVLNRKSPCNCIVPYFHCFIDANGDVLPCCRLANDNGEFIRPKEYIMGNILKQEFSSIWLGESFKEFREDIISNPKYLECKECDRYQQVNNDFSYYIKQNNVFL